MASTLFDLDLHLRRSVLRYGDDINISDYGFPSFDGSKKRRAIRQRNANGWYIGSLGTRRGAERASKWYFIDVVIDDRSAGTGYTSQG